MKATVVNYHNENCVDFYLTLNLTGDRTVEIFCQPDVQDNKVVDISTPDSQDDVAILNAELYDDAIEAMQEELDDYLKR